MKNKTLKTAVSIVTQATAATGTVNRIILEPNATIKAQTNNRASWKCVFIF